MHPMIVELDYQTFNLLLFDARTKMSDFSVKLGLGLGSARLLAGKDRSREHVPAVYPRIWCPLWRPKLSDGYVIFFTKRHTTQH